MKKILKITSKIPFSFVYLIESLFIRSVSVSDLFSKKLYKLGATAVNALVERYRAPLTYFAAGYLGDVFTAEDAVSEAIAKLLVKKPTLRNEHALKTYLYTATKNAAIDILRKRKREKSYFENAARLTIAETEYIDEKLCATDDQRRLVSALRLLSGEYRQILYFYYFEALSVSEICKILGKSKKQVYNLHARAKTALSEILKKEGVNDEI